MDIQQSVFCDEAELKCACNTMLNYIDFIERKRAEFIQIIEVLVRCGISDQKISARLEELAAGTRHPAMLANPVINNTIRSTVTAQISEIARADDFHYPSTLMDDISRILSQFL